MVVSTNAITSEGVTAHKVSRVQAIKSPTVKLNLMCRSQPGSQFQSQEISYPQTTFPVLTFCFVKE